MSTALRTPSPASVSLPPDDPTSSEEGELAGGPQPPPTGLSEPIRLQGKKIAVDLKDDRALVGLNIGLSSLAGPSDVGKSSVERGRSIIGVGSGFVAVATSAGHIRLINLHTTHEHILRPSSHRFSPPDEVGIVDLAVAGMSIAAVWSDGSLVVWRVTPSSKNELSTSIESIVGQSTDSKLHFKLARLFGTSHLAISTQTDIFLLNLPFLSSLFSGEPIDPTVLCRASETDIIHVQSTIKDFSLWVPSTSPGGSFSIVNQDGTFALALFNGRDPPVVLFKKPFDLVGGQGDRAVERVVSLGKSLVAVWFEDGKGLAVVDLNGPFTVLGEIEFVEDQAGGDSRGQMEWDVERSILWVSNLTRCSIYAFSIDPLGSGVFQKMAEFRTNRLTSFALSPAGGFVQGGYTLGSSGINQFDVDPAFLDAMSNVRASPSLHRDPTPSGSELGRSSRNGKVGTLKMPPPPPESPKKPKKGSAAGSSYREPSASSKLMNGELPLVSGLTEEVELKMRSDQPDLGDRICGELFKMEDSIVNKVSLLIEKQVVETDSKGLKRQEAALKHIAKDLKQNANQMVGQAVKVEVQTSVVPTLESIVKKEIRSLVGTEISKGIQQAIVTSLPVELERHLNSRSFASAAFPSIDKSIKDLIQKTLVPSYSRATQEIYSNLSQEIRTDMVDIRKEIVMEQSESLVEMHELVKAMSGVIVSLGEQVSGLQSTVLALHEQIAAWSAPPPPPSSAPPPAAPSVYRPSTEPRAGPAPSSETRPSPTSRPNPNQALSSPSRRAYPSLPTDRSSVSYPTFPAPSLPFSPSRPYPPAHNTLRSPSTSVYAPQPIVPIPNPTFTQPWNPPESTVVDWDDVFIQAFLKKGKQPLAELIAKLEPPLLDRVLPNDPQAVSPLSQSVILTILHKYSEYLTTVPILSREFTASLAFIQRANRLLDKSDPTLQQYIARVIASVGPNLIRVEEALLMRSDGSVDGGERERAFFGELVRGIRFSLAAPI